MRERGDLESGRGRFCVQIPKVRPIVRFKNDEPAFARIGMNVAKDHSKSGLVVLKADHGLQKKTPIAQLNKEEERQAARDESEVHASFAIRPGDRIREVHAEALDKSLKNFGQCHAEQEDEPGMDKKTMSASAMLAELNAATSETSPRVVNLSVSRNLENVLRPCSAPNSRRPLSGRPTSRESTPDTLTPSLDKRRCRANSASIFIASGKHKALPRYSSKQSLARQHGRLKISPVIVQSAMHLNLH